MDAGGRQYSEQAQERVCTRPRVVVDPEHVRKLPVRVPGELGYTRGSARTRARDRWRRVQREGRWPRRTFYSRLVLESVPGQTSLRAVRSAGETLSVPFLLRIRGGNRMRQCRESGSVRGGGVKPPSLPRPSLRPTGGQLSTLRPNCRGRSLEPDDQSISGRLSLGGETSPSAN